MSKVNWPLPTKPLEPQRVAWDKGRQHLNFGYWLEQGLGKTLVDYADFMTYLNRDVVDCHAVIAPSYLKSGWADEGETHGVPWPVFTWPDVPSDKQRRQPFTQVLNTEAVHDVAASSRQGGRWLRELLASKRCMVTIDESTCIARFSSLVTNSVISFMQDAKVRRLLSGLPTPEDVMQWWPQLRALGQLNGINPYAFRNRFAKMGGYMRKKAVGYSNEEELFELVDSCGIRMMKEDWLDLPPKVPMPPIDFEMEGKQLAAFKSMLNEFYTEVDAGEVYADQVIHQLMKLQQISRGFIKDGSTIHELVPPVKNPAIRALKAALINCPGKALVFTYHEYSTKIVFEALQTMKRNPICLRGGLKTEDIRERKRIFNQDTECRDAVMQLSVGSKGHTMLGQPGKDRCFSTFYYENMYSREVRSQSEDRNHRIGQDSESVNYFDLIEDVAGSPTRRALKALARKQDFVDATINAIRTRRQHAH